MRKLLLLVLFIGQITFGQDVNYDSEDYYYLQRTKHLDITLEKGVLSIENNITEKAKYNSSKMLFFANESIPYDSFSVIEDIEAYTEIPATNKIINVDHFETKDEIGGMTFYSEQQTINFVFPAVTKGSETTLKYKEHIKNPYLMGGAYVFGTGVPTKESVYSVEFPNSVEVGYKALNFEGSDIQFEKEINKKTTTYTWRAKDIKEYRSPGNSLPILKYAPHIIVYIKNYTVKRKKIEVLNSLDNLYEWYVSLKNQIKVTDNSEVYKIAEDLVADANSDDEKASKIFNWVQENINYIAFGDGYKGFIPESASDVYTKRYGDCKGMTNLLYEMLNHVGVTAYYTWIGSRNKPYSYYDVHTPIVDDHMIATASINGNYIFLDATDNYVPYGMPSSFIQGKEALISLTDTEYDVYKVPVQEKEKNHTIIETTISFDGDAIKASGKRTMSGYEMVDFVYDAKYKKDDKTEEQYLSTKYEIGNNKTKYTNIDLGDLKPSDESYSISYDLEIRNYAKSVGSKLFLNLNLEKPLAKSQVIIENQKFGKEISHQYVRNYNTTFTIPEGYTLKSVPQNSANRLENYGFSFDYTINENKIILHKEIYLNILEIENEDLEAYNTFIKSLIKAYKKSIVLEKI